MAGGGEQIVQVEGHRLRLTNLQKVLYPETGTTKAEVIDYYSRIAPLLLPQLDGRPVTRIRWPNGVDEPSFFAKDLEKGAPAWLSRMPIDHSTGAKDYPLVRDVADLVYLAQVASLELHVPQWRFTPDGDRGFADRLVLDLDPGPGAGLPECALVATWARGILQGMGMDPVPVTSGSKGIHLYAALPPGQSTDAASALARELATAIEADHPELVVSTQRKTERAGKVLIDWSQNNGAKTTIAPYSMRGRAHPNVAAPRTWEELADPGLRHLGFEEVLERATSMPDPMAILRPLSDAIPRLATYIAKRSAARTPEPVPSDPVPSLRTGAEPRFVIQEHHASRLHYDFRLERDGVLVSWAVPKGVPETTSRNSLAVMTEDHPLDYATFEGTIPAGEYGAGTVTIWDEGTYSAEKWRDDEVIATLHGRPGGPLGTVRLALIRTDGAGEKSTWLLHRTKAQPSATTAGPPSDGEQTDAGARDAVAAGASPVDPGPPVQRSSDRPAQPPGPVPKPMLATSSTEGIARAAFARGGRQAWAEVKWDGIRALGVWNGSKLRLYARSGTDITARYPELTGVDPGFGPDPLIVDGEIVAMDAAGRPSFTRLQNRMHLTKPHQIEAERTRTPVRYVLFDALSAHGEDLTAQPLTARRAALEDAAAHTISEIDLTPVFGDVGDALAAARRFGLEGVVVKDPASRYRPGIRSESWLKVKITRTQEVVIGAIRPGRGGRSGSIGSLLVGVQGDAGLEYVGRVGSGFSDAMLKRLEETLVPLRVDESPFVEVPTADASDALWVRPEVVGEVEFAEWNPGGILRHSRWRGLRPDIAPQDVRRES